MKYITRSAEQQIKKYLKIFPVVAVTGPRQSGKSTMLKQKFTDKYRYISFDDYDNIIFFREDPKGFIKTYNSNIIFDEAQKVPELFSLIKNNVDNNRNKKGKFILSGSSHFLLMKNITESLAGRIGFVNLYPLNFSEIPDKIKDDSLYKGGFPEIALKKYRNNSEWFSAYIKTYIEKDVRQLSNIGDLSDFSRFVKLLSVNSSQIFNLTKYSSDIGVAVNTIKNWLSILETSYIVYILRPYYKNFGKRLTKSPKIYFTDTGIISYFADIQNNKSFENGLMTGAIFENYIILEIIKRNYSPTANFYFFRSSNGLEIDLIKEERNRLEFFEIKSSFTFKPSFLDSIKSLLPPKAKGYLLYRGTDIKYDYNISVLNYKTYFKNLS
jgi:uncharacterized protein